MFGAKTIPAEKRGNGEGILIRLIRKVFGGKAVAGPKLNNICDLSAAARRDIGFDAGRSRPVTFADRWIDDLDRLRGWRGRDGV